MAMAGEQHWFRTGICYFNVRGLAFQKKGGVLRNVFFVTKERCSNCHVFFHYFPRPRCLRLAYSNFNDAFNSACGTCDPCQLTRLSSTHGCTTRPSARLMLRMACKTRGRDAVAGVAPKSEPCRTCRSSWTRINPVLVSPHRHKAAATTSL